MSKPRLLHHFLFPVLTRVVLLGGGSVNFGEVCLSPKFVVISCFLSYALIFVQIHLSILCITSFHILRYVCLLSSS